MHGVEIVGVSDGIDTGRRGATMHVGLKGLMNTLYLERLAFPSKGTRRGPLRLGWAVSTVQVMLRNEKYARVWVWNKTRFLKDPESGRRRPVERPRHEWVTQERPELRIIEPALWASVQARLVQMEQTYGAGGGRPPRGDAHVAYSKYLLSGLVRCASCGARMIAQTATRRRRGRVYRYGWYRCGFAASKGPAVCGHGVWYSQDRLEATLIGRFRDATVPGCDDAGAG
jgi:site-specific DNA recombinase